MFSFLNALVSGSNMGRIYATTDKPYYVAGELVTGNICCESKAPLQAYGVDLKITGYEKTEWHDLKHRTEVVQPARPGMNGQPGQPAVTRSIPVMHRHRGKKVFFSQNIRVYNIGGGLLAPGTYNFPFQYQLPLGLPGSFFERAPMPHVPAGCEWMEDDAYAGTFADSDDEMGADNGRAGLLAVVHYKLKVTLDINNGFFMPDMHARIPLIIHPKLEASLMPAMQTLGQDIKVCCCINKGRCTVTARFDKLAYVAGEVANVRCDIHNESTSVLKTRVTLRRHLLLKSNTGQKPITEDIITAAYDPVPGQTTSMDRPMPLQLVGPKITPSTNGDFVHCNYEYLVVCDVSMGADLNLKMPLTVYMPQPPPVGGPSSPAPPVVVLSPQPQVMIASPSQPMQGQPMQYPAQPMQGQGQMQQGQMQQGQMQQGQMMQPQGQMQGQMQPQQGQMNGQMQPQQGHMQGQPMQQQQGNMMQQPQQGNMMQQPQQGNMMQQQQGNMMQQPQQGNMMQQQQQYQSQPGQFQHQPSQHQMR